MKNITILVLLLISAAATFCQQTNNPTPALTKQDYLQKSKNQKTTAWILLGGGVVFVTGSALWASSDFYSNGPDVLFVMGAASIVGSIPLFIISSKNKKRAMSMAFTNETAPVLTKNNFRNSLIPSLTLKLSL